MCLKRVYSQYTVEQENILAVMTLLTTAVRKKLLANCHQTTIKLEIWNCLKNPLILYQQCILNWAMIFC